MECVVSGWEPQKHGSDGVQLRHRSHVLGVMLDNQPQLRPAAGAIEIRVDGRAVNFLVCKRGDQKVQAEEPPKTH